MCKFCRIGKPHFCREGGLNNTIGIHRSGGWAEYAVAPAQQVHPLPDKISLKQGSNETKRVFHLQTMLLQLYFASQFLV